MKQNDVKNLINAVQQTNIDIRIENGRVIKNSARGTRGSIAFVFTDIYAKLMIGFFDRQGESEAIDAMNKIQKNAERRVREYFTKKKG